MARITPYMCIWRTKLLMNGFFKAQFSYYPLAWMCHSRSINNKINRLHERYLRIIYNEKTLSFADFLSEDESVTIHTRYLQVHAIEMFNVHKKMSKELMQGLFFYPIICYPKYKCCLPWPWNHIKSRTYNMELSTW